MSLKLYQADMSPAVRGTLLTVKALDLSLELKDVDLMAGEHMTPAFLEMNPLHTVPTLQDGDFTVWDSHAINCYIVDKYGKDDSLYPKDLQRRATVHQRLFFNCGTLFPNLSAIVVSILFGGARVISKEKADKVLQGYGMLETLLKRSSFVAGNSVTIADLSIVAVVSSSNILVPVDPKKFPRILEWLGKMQELPYYKEGNQVGLEKFKVVKSKLS